MESTRRRSALRENSDEVSRFILCIKERPILYNYKLPPSERRRADIFKGWQDVADELGITSEECRNKWKNLRDTYHQYRLRKSKSKMSLDKWQYSKDLHFLADIYQPKLKSKRSDYANRHAARNDIQYNINEVQVSEISALIEVDEDTHTSFQDIDGDSLIENDYANGMEHMTDIDEIQFCSVDEMEKINVVETTDETYGEVCLYEEAESLVVAADDLNLSNQEDRKISTYETHRVKRSASSSRELPESAYPTIGNNEDELDFFFQFLKTKIKKLPAADITAIQIEFLNVVLKREAAKA